MHPARIAELLHPFVTPSEAPCHSEERSDEESAVLSSTQLQHISTYIDLLLHWNARINLTSIRDPEEIVTRHFGESLFAARHLFPATAHVGTAAPGCPTERSSALSTVADVGSGAGFPGIPIKLWAPHVALTLIESNQKKTAFLREIIRALTLTNVNVFPGRAEQLLQQRSDPGLTGEELDQPGSTQPRQSKPAQSGGRPQPSQQLNPFPATQTRGQSPGADLGRFDLVTLRAVEHFTSILPVAASLVSPGGRLALLIGASQLDRVQATLPTFAWSPPLVLPRSQSRTLLIARQS